MTLPRHFGVRHVALFVSDLAAARSFYVDLLGYEIEWQPDDDNLYLTSGTDNLALHQAAEPPSANGALDHIGIVLAQADDVDAWHQHLASSGVKIVAEPKTHRDGARSFYCEDPAGNVVQFIHHPPIAQHLPNTAL